MWNLYSFCRDSVLVVFNLKGYKQENVLAFVLDVMLCMY